MKKRALLVAVYCCLFLGFLCGAAELIAAKGERVSESENRMLQGMPALSAQAVLSGRFMDEAESYLSDAFFFREESARFTEKLLGVFSLPAEGPDTGEIDQSRLFAPAETAAPAPTPTETAESPAETEDPAETESPAETEEPAETPEPAAPLRSVTQDAEFYLENEAGERFVIATYPAEQLASFAELLNRYREALPENGTLHFAVPPVSAVANNLLYSGNYTDWGSNLEDVLQGAVEDGVYVYDVADILRPYIGQERLYPVIDHHWQPVSASLVAEEMLRNQGVPPMNYYEYRYFISTVFTLKPFYGEDLKKQPISVDAVQVMEPVSPVRAYLLRHLTETRESVFVDRELGGLKSYLGGLNGPWRLLESGFHTGRNALVIGDSFELTFAPYLMPYYDTVLVTDLRESLFTDQASGDNVRAYIEAYGVTDIYMLYSTYSPFCGEEVQSRLRDCLD